MSTVTHGDVTYIDKATGELIDPARVRAAGDPVAESWGWEHAGATIRELERAQRLAQPVGAERAAVRRALERRKATEYIAEVRKDVIMGRVPGLVLTREQIVDAYVASLPPEPAFGTVRRLRAG